ncbi:serine/threonine kinase [Aureococcus anophagefferens]|nr:serine/threonine kinase [Aureococcus anophagefferens]
MYSLQLSLPFTQPAHCSGSRPGTWAASNWCGAAAPRGTMENLEPIKVLGEGAFGKVYLMRHKVERALCCVKVKNIPKKEREACRMEVGLLKRLNHPNIVMQFCDGGDLSGQIKTAARNRKLFAESKILHWFVQMALGLHYMHAQRVLHRDLKTQNIFLTGNGRLVLGDLGISKEIFKNKPYSYKSDIWALGCVLYEMTTLNHAFDANSLNGLACKIIKGRYPPIASRYSKSPRPRLGHAVDEPDFLTDIANRDAGKIGDGTMAVKAAALCVVTDPANAVAGMGADARAARTRRQRDVSSLRSQLDSLQMGDVIAAAFEPPKRGDAPLNAAQAERAAREQAAALRREEDRRRSVETALAKLKKEREAAPRPGAAPRRGAQARGAPPQAAAPQRRRAQAAGLGPAAAPRQGANLRGAARASAVGRPDDGIPARRSGTTRARPARPRRARPRPRPRPAPRGGGGARRQRRDDDAQRVADLERWEDQQQRAERDRRQRRPDHGKPDRAASADAKRPAARSTRAGHRDHRHDPAAAVDRARAAREGAAAKAHAAAAADARPGDRRSRPSRPGGPAESKPADRRPWDRAPAKAEAKPAFEAYDDAAPPPRRSLERSPRAAPAVAEPMEPEAGLSARGARSASRPRPCTTAYRSSLDPAVGAAPRTTRRSEAKLDVESPEYYEYRDDDRSPLSDAKSSPKDDEPDRSPPRLAGDGAGVARARRGARGGRGDDDGDDVDEVDLALAESDDDDGDDDEGEQIGWAQPDRTRSRTPRTTSAAARQLKAELELTTQRCEAPQDAPRHEELESARFAQPPPLDEEPDGAASWRSKVTEDDDDCLYEEDEEDDEDMVPVQTRLPPPQPAASASRPGPIAANLTPRGAEHELTDAPSPTGRLAARAPRPAILGPDKVHFSSLIDQLIFMEDSL